MSETVSVIIPTYNRSKSLLLAINSVLTQKTSAKIEILVCDDGSTDNTDLLIKNLVKKHKSIRYLKNRHTGGPAAPRNIGIKQARGYWLAFLDSDDIWSPNKLEMQLTFAKKNDLQFVCTNAYIKNKKKLLYFNSLMNSTNISFSKLIKENIVICSSVLLKRDLALEVNGFPEEKSLRAIEDYACWLKYSLNNDLGYISEPLLTYSDSPHTTIRNLWQSSKEQYQSIIPYIYHWYFENIKLESKYLYNLIPLTLARLKNI